MGVILFLTPFVLSVCGIFLAAVTSSSFEVTGEFAMMSVSASGFVAMIYVSILRFKNTRRKRVNSEIL
jgi:uncharacterized membrane protein